MQYTQTSSSLQPVDNATSSAASSPSAAYAGLSIEGGEPIAYEGTGISAGPDQGRGQSSILPFAHRAIMGAAADLPQRSSSPMKRRASNLEGEGKGEHKAEHVSSLVEDVDMVNAPEIATAQGEEAPASDSESVDMEATPDDYNANSTGMTQETSDLSLNADIPPIDVQIITVQTMLAAANETPLQENNEVYLVSKLWLERVISRGSEARQKTKTEPEGEIGYIDNSDIVKQVIKDYEGKDFAVLKTGLGQDRFELFPAAVWQMVLEWHGIMPGAVPLHRIARNTAPDKFSPPNIQVEYYPLVFTVHRIWSEVAPVSLPKELKAENPKPPVLVVSRTMGYQLFLRKLKDVSRIDTTRKIRLWGLAVPQASAKPSLPPSAAATPPSSRPNSPAPATMPTIRIPQDSWPDLLVDVVTFLKLEKSLERQLIDAEDQTNNPKYNGSMNLSMIGLGESQSLAIDPFVSGTEYVSTYVAKDKKSSKTVVRGNLSTSQTNSGRTSPAPSIGPMTRGRTGVNKSGRLKGAVGLANLGNTCYMNSALQCVRSVEELTKYFLNGDSVSEINEDNPLGNHGEVARVYGRLLKAIYADGAPTSVVPRDFKNIIGRYAPSFSGYGQQDSQEFLGFLLDGLQEDLSRVKKKPYIEKPDSTDDMINNPEAIRRMAAEVWEISKKRDDSVIADLFTGMYKSTVVCPVCDKVSITFDPFNNLTLQLPIETVWNATVHFLPLNSKPIKLVVEVDKQGNMRAFKKYVGQKFGVPTERLFVAEEYKQKFYKLFPDHLIASEEISTNDNIIVFELEAPPTNWPTPARIIKKKPKKFNSYAFNNNDSDEEEIPGWNDPLADRMLVPVFYRYPNDDFPNTNRFSARNHSEWVLAPVPHFIMLTPEEAKDEDRIKRKVLEKVATLTTYSLDDEVDTNGSVEDNVDPEIVTNSSESSVEGKVVANSVDGEDGLVDITMKDSILDHKLVDESTELTEKSPSTPFSVTKNRRPKFLEPGTLLKPELQNMFQLKYFKGNNQLLPTGWTAVDEDKTYPTLASRVPQVEVDEPVRQSDGSEPESDEDEDDHVASATRMMEESSDEDELSGPTPPRVALPLRTARSTRVGYKKRGKPVKTYSKKGHKSLNQASTLESTPEPSDDGPLIRLGEGLVVDWQADAYNSLFGEEHPSDTFYGSPTWTHVETFQDDERLAKEKARLHRKKTGISLDDCLDEFEREEILSEQDTWYCPKCKEHRRAAKKFELWRTPDILVVHLKRFSSSQYRREKVEVLVDFPIEGLDLSSRVVESQPGKQEVYDLFAVDDHSGGLGGGHYTAFAKNFLDHQWYEHNDSMVNKTDISRIITRSAYLLFYRRRSDVPLGGPRFQQIVNDFDKSTEISEASEPSEDDTTESGEGKGLGTNSSLRGLSSALTGAGAIRRHPGNLGSDDSQMTTLNPNDLEELPAYGQRNSDPVLIEGERSNLHASIEGPEDEGVDMSPPILPTWTWDSLDLPKKQFPSGAGSEVDNNSDRGFEDSEVRSDIVENVSSVGSITKAERLAEFNIATPDDFEDPPEVPDIDDMSVNANLARFIQSRLSSSSNKEHFVVETSGEGMDEDEPAAEIHVEEGEGLRPKGK
ncbi:hypothetical protein BJ878DRAFT_542082 [Calycina marina]|uniref:ubiquitinyl hydrolase 1 n=1 Tax=Calycina marina TaxID=1763456 RepID=A0A9P7Z3L0_9HELO|nr:hypothetical protein BJ878DRAFT_542082 [Calycina marina]